MIYTMLKFQWSEFVAPMVADSNQSPSSIIHPLCVLCNPSLTFHVYIHPNLHTAQSPLQYAWRTWQVEYIPGIIVVVLWNKNVIMLTIFVIDCTQRTPDSKVHGANMGPTWVLLSPGGPHVGPMNLAIWDLLSTWWHHCFPVCTPPTCLQ